MRIRIDLAYDGTDFSGWARQPGLRTVEEELARALGTVLRTGTPSLTVGGRTDAGVHARGSVAHVDVDEQVWRSVPGRSDRPPGEALTARLRGVLPPDIVVRRTAAVCEAFDARFSALRRRYTYRLCDRAPELDPLRRRDTVVVRRNLDEASMDRAASTLLGLHDFAAFCRPREGATTVRTLLGYRWERQPDGVLVGTVEADAFCHSMVRALVGAVVAVGEGRRAPTWPADVLAARRRDPGVQVMPAHGLCLEEIVYPGTDAELGERAVDSRAIRVLPGATGEDRVS
ncbi:tRNA pseudouridine(38-40) synthase TruA [Ornithinimicrobium cerasi]|uniref:tRNA pseudouridine(38-40) synthase TruA n=1 Tax=Ornithinimicrobium cerasi TaxID=2248773 RepID=UPI000EFE661A|nr:tRNA pseudouridine(38-40) synthase TruA [Ornithinimicrobium cerasi]